jgi:hypothetical protein
MPDDVHRSAQAECSIPQRMAEHRGELKDMDITGKLENIEGIFIIGTGDNRDTSADFSDGKSNGGINQIIICRNNQGGILYPETMIGRRIIGFSNDHLIPGIIQLGGPLQLIDDKDILNISPS